MKNSIVVFALFSLVTLGVLSCQDGETYGYGSNSVRTFKGTDWNISVRFLPAELALKNQKISAADEKTRFFEMEAVPISPKALTRLSKSYTEGVMPMPYDSIRYFMAKDFSLISGTDTLPFMYINFIEEGMLANRLLFRGCATSESDDYALLWRDRYFCDTTFLFPVP